MNTPCKRGRKCGSTCCKGRYGENIGSVGTNEQWQERNSYSIVQDVGKSTREKMERKNIAFTKDGMKVQVRE
jgi:hypothetical protein